MDRETSCLSCHGTGTILAPYDARPGYAHAYEIVCGCGIFLERHEQLGVHGYQTGQTLPWKTHRQALARAAGFVAWVDEALVADIERLWEAGVETISSCQGSDDQGRMLVIRRKQDVAAARNLLPWIAIVTERDNSVLLEEKEHSRQYKVVLES